MYNALVLDYVKCVTGSTSYQCLTVSNYLLYWPFRSNNFVTFNVRVCNVILCTNVSNFQWS